MLKLIVGGVHNRVERDHVEAALKQEMLPETVIVSWRARVEGVPENIVVVEGATEKQFGIMQTKIQQGLDTGRCFRHVVARSEDLLNDGIRLLLCPNMASSQRRTA